MTSIARRVLNARAHLVSYLIILMSLGLGAVAAARIPHLLADEQYHGPQIHAFMSGNFAVRPGITVIPGYHLVVALIATIFGAYSDNVARCASFAIGLLYIPLSWKVTAEVAKDPAERTAQNVVQPFVFPFLFLIYTDVWSLCLLLLLVLALLRRRYIIAAIGITLGFFVRQDFIVWIALALGMSAQAEFSESRGNTQEPLRSWLRKVLPFSLPALVFGLFVLWNGAIALGDRAMHHAGVNITNVYFMLACGWLLFAPVHLRDARAVLGAMTKRSALVIELLCFGLYLLTYSNTHPYNQPNLRFFLHNEALYWIGKSLLLRCSLFLAIAYMAMWMYLLADRERRLVFPLLIGAFSVAMHPLIEPRYYLPLFVMMNTLRPESGIVNERAFTTWEVALSAVVMWGIATVHFFP